MLTRAAVEFWRRVPGKVYPGRDLHSFQLVFLIRCDSLVFQVSLAAPSWPRARNSSSERPPARMARAFSTPTYRQCQGAKAMPVAACRVLRAAEDKAIFGSISRQPLIGPGSGQTSHLSLRCPLQNIRRVSGSVLAGLRHGHGQRRFGRGFLFRAAFFQVRLFCGIQRQPAGSRVLIAGFQRQGNAAVPGSLGHGAVLLSSFRFQLLAVASSATASSGVGSAVRGRFAFTSASRPSARSRV